MKYEIIISPVAKEDIQKLKRSEPSAFKKLAKLLLELGEHPETGTGKPEKLKGDLSGKWSRRITDKHRIIYSIDNSIINVIVLSCWGHYEDK
ncbi:MAG: Txe/YoeB family addiction module toxin [Paludibacteraceae bacterium]|nr:Txe/YoeB family addiction module toxin [Paludibacteraceae bacterium]